MVTVTLTRLGTARTREPELQNWGPDAVPAPALLDLPHPSSPGWGGDVVRRDRSAGQREARAIHSRRRLPAGEPCGSRSAITAAPSAASTLAPSSSAPVTTPSGLGTYVGAAMLSKIRYSPRRPPLPPVTKVSAKVRTVPVPLKGPSRGSATSAPKQHGVGGERRRVRARTRHPLKRWRRPGRRVRASGDVTSGAEEPEWCSEGQTKGGAGGARRPVAGLSGGGPGAACWAAGRGGPR